MDNLDIPDYIITMGICERLSCIYAHLGEYLLLLLFLFAVVMQQFCVFDLYGMICRSLVPVLLDVSLGSNKVRILMLESECLSQRALHLCLDQWSQPRTILRTILPWHDGG